jgi:hypothetical protein
MMRTSLGDVRWLGPCALITLACGPTNGTNSKTSGDDWAEGGGVVLGSVGHFVALWRVET